MRLLALQLAIMDWKEDMEMTEAGAMEGAGCVGIAQATSHLRHLDV
jgi:hypothetical protein